MVEYSFKKEDIKKITKQYVWTFIPPLMAIGIVFILVLGFLCAFKIAAEEDKDR